MLLDSKSVKKWRKIKVDWFSLDVQVGKKVKKKDGLVETLKVKASILQRYNYRKSTWKL